MNINKNKSIRKGFVFSKAIFPTVGALFLVTQTGCVGFHKHLGIVERGTKNEEIALPKEEQNNSTHLITLYEDRIRPHLDNGTKVCSDAQKFIIFIPKLPNDGASPVYPPEHPKAGQKIVDWENNPIGYNGFVFVNPTDKCQQVAKGDGTGVIIINQPTQAQQEKLQNKISTLNSKLTIEVLQELYDYMVKELKINDLYSSDIEYVNKKLKKINNDIVDDHACFGLYRRNDQENHKICKAIFIPGNFEFQCKSTSIPQKFEDGGVMVQQGDDHIRGVQPDIFEKTYTDINSNTIKVTDLQVIHLQEILKKSSTGDFGDSWDGFFHGVLNPMQPSNELC